MDTELSPKAAEIVAYTRILLESGGYNSFSYADIAAQVNISKASIHHHFPTKVDLVREVVARYRAEARAGLALLEGQLDNPLGELTAYSDYWSSCILGGTSSFCIGAMLAAELPTLPTEVAAEVRGHFDDLSQWLTSTMTRGLSRGQLQLHATPQVEARTFMAAVHGAMLAARGLGEPAAFESLVRVSLDRLAPAA